MSAFAAVGLDVMNPPFRQLLGPNKRDPAPFATLPMWLYLYFDVLIERRQHAQQLSTETNLNCPRSSLEMLGCFTPTSFAASVLSDLPLRHQPLQLYNEGCLELVLVGVREAVGRQLLLRAHDRAAFIPC